MDQPNAQPAENTTRRSNKTLWIMIILFGLPYVAALYVYLNRDDISFGTQGNYGTVLSPARELGNEILTLIDGNSMRFSDADVKGKWLLLTISSARCDQACMENMYKMRQIRTATGEDSIRLQRVLLLTDDHEIDNLKSKLTDYDCMHTQLNDRECLKIIRYDGNTSNSIFNTLKVEGHELSDGVYVVDPMSRYMMYYPPDADPRKMLKDIQRLLKVSQIG